MERTTSDVLNEAADLLETRDNWNQGSFFNSKNGKTCMCAHGAIAYCINDELRSDIDADIFYTSLADIFYTSLFKGKHNISLQTLAHAAATKSGLTIYFNDRPSTTKQQVIEKLREAAQSSANECK